MAVAEAPRASRAPKAARDQESRSCQSSKTRRPSSAVQAADAVREEQAAHRTDPRATESAPSGAVSECDPSPCPRGRAEPHGNSAPRTRRQRQRHEIDHGEIHTAAKSSLFLHDLQVPQISHQVSRGIAVRESALADRYQKAHRSVQRSDETTCNTRHREARLAPWATTAPAEERRSSPHPRQDAQQNAEISDLSRSTSRSCDPPERTTHSTRNTAERSKPPPRDRTAPNLHRA